MSVLVSIAIIRPSSAKTSTVNAVQLTKCVFWVLWTKLNKSFLPTLTPLNLSKNKSKKSSTLLLKNYHVRKTGFWKKFRTSFTILDWTRWKESSLMLSRKELMTAKSHVNLFGKCRTNSEGTLPWRKVWIIWKSKYWKSVKTSRKKWTISATTLQSYFNKWNKKKKKSFWSLKLLRQSKIKTSC